MSVEYSTTLVPGTDIDAAGHSTSIRELKSCPSSRDRQHQREVYLFHRLDPVSLLLRTYDKHVPSTGLCFRQLNSVETSRESHTLSHRIMSPSPVRSGVNSSASTSQVESLPNVVIHPSYTRWSMRLTLCASAGVLKLCLVLGVCRCIMRRLASNISWGSSRTQQP